MGRIVFYGNCQAGWLATNLQQVAARHPDFPHEIVAVYSESADALDRLRAELDGASHLFFQTMRRMPRPPKDVRSTTRVVGFPALYMRPFWPFASGDARVGLDDRIVIGDAMLNHLAHQGLTSEEVFNQYLAADMSRVCDLDGIWRDQLRRWRRMEAFCEIKISDWIEENFRKQQLFELFWHPTQTLYRQLGRQVCELLDLGPEHRATSEMVFDHHPTPAPRIPIHPTVAEHFKLEWWTGPDHRYDHFGKMVTFEEWLWEHITWRPAVEAAA